MLTAMPPKSRTIKSIERKEDCLYLCSEYGMLCLEPKSGSIVRIRFAVSKEFSGKEKPGIVCHEAFSEWEYSEEEDRVMLTMPSLKVAVNRSSSALSFFDGNDRLLFSQDPEQPVEFEAFDSYHLADAEQKTKQIETADGKKDVIEEPLKTFTGRSYHIRIHFALGDEAIYGFGQQEKGCASLRGKHLYLHQANRKIAIPMFVSTNGYGILTDTYAPMIFHDGADGTYLYLEADQELDQYFIAGNMNEVIMGYRLLSGKAALLPKWAFGYVQSQERYESQEEILGTVAKSRELGIGMDCIVLDWLSWGDNQWGQKSYDEKRFPDPAAMIGKLHEEHVHFMISIWPNMGDGTENHEEFAAKRLLLPGSGVYDALKKEARDLYFEQLKRTHFSYGTDAWWCDSSEPYTPEWGHGMRPEEGQVYQEYLKEAGLRLPYEYSNSFALYHALGIWENQREAMKDGAEKRVCNLTRSAYTGQQRYGTVMWSGDTAASWETLRDQIAIGLHFSVSGLPFWTTDIGAFFVKRGNVWYWNGEYDETTDSKAYCELYVRWYQFAAFLPMFRAHGTDCRRELWNFRDEFYDALLKANRLRYRLMPYIYSEAGKVWLKDRSMIRWLAFDFAEDKNTWEIRDQFLFGESLMVCPVTEAMYYEKDGSGRKDVLKSRSVYFPAGCDWYDLLSGERYAGGSRQEVPAPLDVIPVFAREGSVIPMAQPARSTEEQGEDYEAKRFPGKARPYEFYSDAGDGYGYERGEYKLVIL
ncbi:MAG: DUF4968 domain-containing protein [Lachnospiraceae bacterium]|nr:DUF4968 domain-containing protein [Lachnospiraceae bacterium]